MAETITLIQYGKQIQVPLHIWNTIKDFSGDGFATAPKSIKNLARSVGLETAKVIPYTKQPYEVDPEQELAYAKELESKGEYGMTVLDKETGEAYVHTVGKVGQEQQIQQFKQTAQISPLMASLTYSSEPTSETVEYNDTTSGVYGPPKTQAQIEFEKAKGSLEHYSIIAPVEDSVIPYTFRPSEVVYKAVYPYVQQFVEAFGYEYGKTAQPTAVVAGAVSGPFTIAEIPEFVARAVVEPGKTGQSIVQQLSTQVGAAKFGGQLAGGAIVSFVLGAIRKPATGTKGVITGEITQLADKSFIIKGKGAAVTTTGQQLKLGFQTLAKEAPPKYTAKGLTIIDKTKPVTYSIGKTLITDIKTGEFSKLYTAAKTKTLPGGDIKVSTAVSKEVPSPKKPTPSGLITKVKKDGEFVSRVKIDGGYVQKAVKVDFETLTYQKAAKGEGLFKGYFKKTQPPEKQLISGKKPTITELDYETVLKPVVESQKKAVSEVVKAKTAPPAPKVVGAPKVTPKQEFSIDIKQTTDLKEPVMDFTGAKAKTEFKLGFKKDDMFKRAAARKVGEISISEKKMKTGPQAAEKSVFDVGQKKGLGFEMGLKSGLKVKSVPKSKSRQEFKLKTKTTQKTAPSILGDFGFGTGKSAPPPIYGRRRKTKKKRRFFGPIKTRQRVGYAPSLGGIISPRKAKKAPKIVTGFGVRPVISKKGKLKKY